MRGLDWRHGGLNLRRCHCHDYKFSRLPSTRLCRVLQLESRQPQGAPIREKWGHNFGEGGLSQTPRVCSFDRAQRKTQRQRGSIQIEGEGEPSRLGEQACCRLVCGVGQLQCWDEFFGFGVLARHREGSWGAGTACPSRSSRGVGVGAPCRRLSCLGSSVGRTVITVQKKRVDTKQLGGGRVSGWLRQLGRRPRPRRGGRLCVWRVPDYE